MTGRWTGSTRAAQLPHNWKAIRQLIIERDNGRCQQLMRDGTQCPDTGTDVDHIERGNNHNLDNLKLLCTWHHNQKSSAEGNAARTRLTEQHPKESHPGLI